MITITHKNLDKLANEHFDSIKNKISDISEKILKDIILAKPNELKNIANKYQIYNDKFKNKYANFSRKKKEYNAYDLAEKLNVVTCPYCNRNAIDNLKSIKNRTLEFDHFYPQKKYPVLSLSFYNLIPSCKVCNHLKRDREHNFFNPYDKRFDFNKNVKFDIKILNSSFVYSTNEFRITCKTTNKNITKDEKRKVRNNIQVFKLNDLYQNHKDTVLELIQKREIYPDSYIDELAQNYSGLFKNREDLLRLITCGYVEDKDLGKRPLSKLIKDISEELELI